MWTMEKKLFLHNLRPVLIVISETGRTKPQRGLRVKVSRTNWQLCMTLGAGPNFKCWTRRPTEGNMEDEWKEIEPSMYPMTIYS